MDLFLTWSFSLDYISHMNCNKNVKFLVWMGEMFAVWDAVEYQSCAGTSSRVSAHPDADRTWAWSTKMRKLMGWEGKGLISKGEKLELTFPWSFWVLVLGCCFWHCCRTKSGQGPSCPRSLKKTGAAQLAGCVSIIPTAPTHFRAKARTGVSIKNI